MSEDLNDSCHLVERSAEEPWTSKNLGTARTLVGSWEFEINIGLIQAYRCVYTVYIHVIHMCLNDPVDNLQREHPDTEKLYKY